MSRSCWKPSHISTKQFVTFKHFIAEKAALYSLVEHNYKLLRYFVKKNRLSYVLRFFRGQHLRRNVTDVILQPTSRDTILRLYTFFQTWQILSYSHVRVRKPKFVKKWRRGIKYYYTSRYMSLQKYGCFKKTRRYRPFRCKVDKKKIQKLKKDVVKAAKKKLHLRKERIRLMKKAVKETRERDSAKARAKASLRKKQN